MDGPEPELDERFSDPGATATPWATTRAVLEDAQLSWLVTVRDDGRPHVTPLVAVWLDDAVHFATGPNEQKAKNLDGNQRGAMIAGSDRWDDGLDVVVEGEARRVTDRATLQHLAEAWSTKRTGEWTFGVSDEGFTHPDTVGAALVYRIEPDKV